MNSRFKFLIACLVIMAISIFALKANAVSPSSISVDIVPLNPIPGESTAITLSSYGSNLDSVLISWFVTGKKVSSSIGMKSFIVKAPAAGSEIVVRAVITLPDGEIEKNILIRSNVMVLLWQATDSYVPPFYRGKAMPATDGAVKVVAMPEIRNKSGLVNPKNMVYSWKLNYTNDAGGSGYGKNSLTYTNNYLADSDNVGVAVSTIDGQYSSQASIDISASTPQISFYKNDSSLGTLWEQALKDGHKIQGDEIIVAEPYFISPKQLWNPSLVWSWFINDNMVNNGLSGNKNWLPIKIAGGATGTSNLRLDIENKNQILETASRGIRLEF